MSGTPHACPLAKATLLQSAAALQHQHDAPVQDPDAPGLITSKLGDWSLSVRHLAVHGIICTIAELSWLHLSSVTGRQQRQLCHARPPMQQEKSDTASGTVHAATGRSYSTKPSRCLLHSSCNHVNSTKASYLSLRAHHILPCPVVHMRAHRRPLPFSPSAPAVKLILVSGRRPDDALPTPCLTSFLSTLSCRHCASMHACKARWAHQIAALASLIAVFLTAARGAGSRQAAVVRNCPQL